MHFSGLVKQLVRDSVQEVESRDEDDGMYLAIYSKPYDMYVSLLSFQSPAK